MKQSRRPEGSDCASVGAALGEAIGCPLSVTFPVQRPNPVRYG
jgi:hypothetical protein